MDEEPLRYGAMGEAARRTARVLVVDPDGRVLLLAERGAGPEDTVWLTPGGGVDPGETVVEAAHRELREEVGLEVPGGCLLGPVAVQARLSSTGDARYRVDDWIFLTHVDAFEPDMSGLTEFERGLVVGSRWWTEEELETTVDEVYPEELPRVLAALQRSGVPDEPWVLGGGS